MTLQYEMVYSRYVLPFCLQFPNQMLQMKSKPLYSYLANEKAFIRDQAKFKAIIDQYLDRVLLLLVYLGENNENMTIWHQQKTIKEKVMNEVLSMSWLENELVALFTIDNFDAYSTIEKKTIKQQAFSAFIFTDLQKEEIYFPFKQIRNIKMNGQKDNDINDEGYNDTILSTTSTLSTDSYSNYNLLTKTRPPRHSQRKRKPIKYQYPLLRDFNSKVFHKNAVDKPILRAFRVWIDELMKERPEVFKTYDILFWNDFATLKLIPPMKYIGKEHQNVEFKSINTNYLNWLFSKKGATKLFKTFIKCKGERVVKSISETRVLKHFAGQDAENKVRTYLHHFPCIYSPSWVEDGEYIVPVCSCTDFRLEFEKILLEEETPHSKPSALDLTHPDFDPNPSVVHCNEEQVEEANINKICLNNCKSAIGYSDCCSKYLDKEVVGLYDDSDYYEFINKANSVDEKLHCEVICDFSD